MLYLGGFGADISGFQNSILTDIAPDDADKGSTPTDYAAATRLDNFTVTAANSNSNNVWNGHFQAIARANQALDKIALSPADATTKTSGWARCAFCAATSTSTWCATLGACRGGWSDLGYGFNNPSADLANAYEVNDVRRAGTIIFINPTAPAGQRSVGTVLWDGFRIPGKDSVENFCYSYKACHSRTREPNCGNNDHLPRNIWVMRYAEMLLISAKAAF